MLDAADAIEISCAVASCPFSSLHATFAGLVQLRGRMPSLPSRVALFIPAVCLPALQQAVIVAAIGFIVCVFILVGAWSRRPVYFIALPWAPRAPLLAGQWRTAKLALFRHQNMSFLECVNCQAFRLACAVGAFPLTHTHPRHLFAPRSTSSASCGAELPATPDDAADNFESPA